MTQNLPTSFIIPEHLTADYTCITRTWWVVVHGLRYLDTLGLVGLWSIFLGWCLDTSGLVESCSMVSGWQLDTVLVYGLRWNLDTFLSSFWCFSSMRFEKFFMVPQFSWVLVVQTVLDWDWLSSLDESGTSHVALMTPNNQLNVMKWIRSRPDELKPTFNSENRQLIIEVSPWTDGFYRRSAFFVSVVLTTEAEVLTRVVLFSGCSDSTPPGVHTGLESHTESYSNPHVNLSITIWSGPEQESKTRTCRDPGPGVFRCFLPAHDLVCEQNSAHLWVLVLTFIDDGLKHQTHTHEDLGSGDRTQL